MEDADLISNKMNICSCTSIIVIVRYTPVKYFTKVQSSVKVNTYRSEFVAMQYTSISLLETDGQCMAQLEGLIVVVYSVLNAGQL